MLSPDLHVEGLEDVLVGRVEDVPFSPGTRVLAATAPHGSEREFFIDNLLVRIHCIIVMIRWTGLAPWEFEFPVPGSLTSTFLARFRALVRARRNLCNSASQPTLASVRVPGWAGEGRASASSFAHPGTQRDTGYSCF